jgi:hypothetical protein
MNLFGPRARSVALAGLCATALLSPLPAFAGAAETALLESYVGSWKGRGVLVGGDKETVVCNMKVSPGNQGKLNYSGRCAMAGQRVSVNGTLAYIDSRNRYEAAMTTNAGFTGVAIGKKSGSGVVFNLREQAQDEAGNNLAITADIALSGEKIMVQFNATFLSTGQTLAATVPFTK